MFEKGFPVNLTCKVYFCPDRRFRLHAGINFYFKMWYQVGKDIKVQFTSCKVTRRNIRKSIYLMIAIW